MGVTSFMIDEPKEPGMSPGSVYKRLFDFDTAKHDLKEGHKTALLSEIVPLLKDLKDPLNITIADVKGHASRLNKTGQNTQHSILRSLEVTKFLIGQVKNAGVIVPYSIGDSRPRGKGDNDAIDRAVLIHVRAAKLPPPPTWVFEFPDFDLEKKGFLDTPWFINSVSGFSLTKGLGIGSAFIVLEQNVGTKELANYFVIGVSAGVGISTDKLGFLGKFLKRILDKLKGASPSYGSSSLPTYGSEIVINPLHPASTKPILATYFEGFVTVTTAAAGAVIGANGNLVIFSSVPLTPFVPLPFVIKGVGVYAGPGINLGIGVETLHGFATRVTGSSPFP